MDYELMMNGNVKIGQRAPDFEAITTFGPVKLNDYKENGWYFFHIQEILPPLSLHLWMNR